MPVDYYKMPPARVTEINTAIASEVPASLFTVKSDFTTGGLNHVRKSTVQTLRFQVSLAVRNNIDSVLAKTDVTETTGGLKSALIPYRYSLNTSITGTSQWLRAQNVSGTSLQAYHAMPYTGQLFVIELANMANGANGTVTIRVRRNNVDIGNLLNFGWGGVRGRTIDVRSQGHQIQRGDTIAVACNVAGSPTISRPIIALYFYFPDIEEIDTTGQNYTLNTTGW